MLEGPYTQSGTAQIAELLGNPKDFTFPKPSELIRSLVRYANPERDFIVLDFFASSGSTGRTYDADGNPQPGEYARIFEEEYARAAKLPEYQTLFKEVDLTSAPSEVHNGYFSIDKKKVGGKTVEFIRDTKGNTQADEDTYSLIMRDKEKLLSFDSKLKFIFSHSALREGWDNPNVFQVCVLREMSSEQQRRQTIWRGLRLCRNQDGDRVFGHMVNRLTVIATESYEDFAKNLQQEIEKETGIRFGVVEAHQLAVVPVSQADGSTKPLGMEQAEQLWQHLRQAGYVDSRGKIQDALRVALKNKTVVLPAPFQAQQGQIESILRKLAGKLEVKNADDRRQVKTREAILHGEQFKAFWDRIKHRTTYRVQFDNAAQINSCIDGLKEHFDKSPVGSTRLQWHKADITIGKSGVDAAETAAFAPVALEEHELPLPDLWTRAGSPSGRPEDRCPDQFLWFRELIIDPPAATCDGRHFLQA